MSESREGTKQRTRHGDGGPASRGGGCPTSRGGSGALPPWQCARQSGGARRGVMPAGATIMEQHLAARTRPTAFHPPRRTQDGWGGGRGGGQAAVRPRGEVKGGTRCPLTRVPPDARRCRPGCCHEDEDACRPRAAAHRLGRAGPRPHGPHTRGGWASGLTHRVSARGGRPVRRARDAPLVLRRGRGWTRASQRVAADAMGGGFSTSEL